MSEPKLEDYLDVKCKLCILSRSMDVSFFCDDCKIDFYRFIQAKNRHDNQKYGEFYTSR